MKKLSILLVVILLFSSLQVFAFETDVRDLKVTKVWVGQPAKEVTVILYGDEVEVERIILNPTNKWEHTFKDLKAASSKYESILYQVEEVAVEGYKSEITNTFEDVNDGFHTGFLITNSWIGGDKVEKVKEVKKPAEIVKAAASASKILVNGKEVVFDAYLIAQNNYFKLRDLAKILSGSEKQFDVKWNGDKEAIELISDEPYKEVGGELQLGDGIAKEIIANTSKVYKDGKLVELQAYTINGNNYFKLRDIGKSFNIGISWDKDTSTVIVDTSVDYQVE